jgi:DNA repair exonuclease SbcCD ATPase subunit
MTKPKPQPPSVLTADAADTSKHVVGYSDGTIKPAPECLVAADDISTKRVAETEELRHDPAPECPRCGLICTDLESIALHMLVCHDEPAKESGGRTWDLSISLLSGVPATNPSASMKVIEFSAFEQMKRISDERYANLFKREEQINELKRRLTEFNEYYTFQNLERVEHELAWTKKKYEKCDKERETLTRRVAELEAEKLAHLQLIDGQAEELAEAKSDRDKEAATVDYLRKQFEAMDEAAQELLKERDEARAEVELRGRQFAEYTERVNDDLAAMRERAEKAEGKAKGFSEMLDHSQACTDRALRALDFAKCQLDEQVENVALAEIDRLLGGGD